MKRISAFIVITFLSISMFSAFALQAKASTIDISAQYSSFVSAYNNYKQIFGQDVSIGQTVDRTLSGVISDPFPHHIWNSWAGQTYPGPGDGFSIRIETIQPDYVYKIIGLGYMAGSQPSASGWIQVNSPYNIEQINYVQNVTYGDGSYVHIYVDKSTGRVDFDAKWWNWPALIDAPAFEFAFTIAKPGGVLPAFSYDATRTRAAYTYDTDTKRVVMFGGYTHWNGTLNADLWTFDPTTFQWTSITAGNQPAGRSDASLSYDSVAENLVTFGGGTISGETGETWTFQFTGSNTGTWTQVAGAGPSARAVAPMVFDPKNDLHVLFGGGQYVYSLGDTWVFNPSTSTWSNANPSPSPSQRLQPGMAYDVKSGKVLLFGGLNKGAGSLLSDTWLYDAATNMWQQVAPPTAPSARQAPSLACDGNGVFYLFGGWNMDAGGHSQYLSDTWKFDMATMQWTQLSPSTSPPPQSQGALLYLGNSRFILINGWRDSPLGEIWFYDSSQNCWSTTLQGTLSISNTMDPTDDLYYYMSGTPAPTWPIIDIIYAEISQVNYENITLLIRAAQPIPLANQWQGYYWLLDTGVPAPPYWNPIDSNDLNVSYAVGVNWGADGSLHVTVGNVNGTQIWYEDARNHPATYFSGDTCSITIPLSWIDNLTSIKWVAGSTDGVASSTGRHDKAPNSGHASLSVCAAIPLSVSISPPSASTSIGNSVGFTSTAMGGIPPYSYQWYLNGAPVSSATSASWVFMPSSGGTYHVYVQVTDSLQPIGNVAQSETANVTVSNPNLAAPVGGYSFQIQVPTGTEPLLTYIALMSALTVVFTKVKPNTKRKR